MGMMMMKKKKQNLTKKQNLSKMQNVTKKHLPTRPIKKTAVKKVVTVMKIRCEKHLEKKKKEKMNQSFLCFCVISLSPLLLFFYVYYLNFLKINFSCQLAWCIVLFKSNKKKLRFLS